MSSKSSHGNFFEDFRLGQSIVHATPRTLTQGDAALALALTGSRFVLQCSQSFARAVGYPAAPLDDVLVFNVVFGKTVPDISLNAVANLGYAECRFLAPVYAGDTLAARSQVIGLRQTSKGDAGIVYVRSTATIEDGTPVLDYVRWVMVRKRDPGAPEPDWTLPELAETVSAEALGSAVPPLDVRRWDAALAGSPARWGDYAPGECIDHVDGVTVEEAEHQMATRLYQNPARVHFDQHVQQGSRFGRRLIYGGHVISIARALSFNGLANAFHVAAINSGRHVAPCFAGDTIYAWSEVLAKAELPGRSDVGALRLRTIATKNRTCERFPHMAEVETYEDGVILDLDYWVLMPR